MYDWGLKLVECKDYEPALKRIEDAIALNPHHEMALIYKGQILARLGQHEEDEPESGD